MRNAKKDQDQADAKGLPGFIIFCSLALLIHASAEAQAQKRNFNLNCGLIGAFAQYPQHTQLCKWEILCGDPRTCVRKLVAPEKLEIDAQPGDPVTETVGETTDQNPTAAAWDFGALAAAQQLIQASREGPGASIIVPSKLDSK